MSGELSLGADSTISTIDLRDVTLPAALDLADFAENSEIIISYAQTDNLSVVGDSSNNILRVDLDGVSDGHEITNFDYSAADGNDRVIFDFGESGGKTISLDVDSAIQLGLHEDTFQSINGTVDSSAATVTGVENVVINSSITISSTQLEEGFNLANLNGAGELNILIDDSFQVDVHTIDLSALAALPGGSKPPGVKIDAGDSIGFGEKDVTLPGGSEPVVVLLRTAGGDGEFASIGGFDESAQYF